uniref:Pyruvate kinase n=1 Tax=Magnetococcus massalia (strain MO-1) TaxID=451514 RepID=A0A1S7LQ08_MAGMO|nr:Pyruvate kinase [Candidatus Magnetococcus massalia]
MSSFRRTKIVATLGPNAQSRDFIKHLALSGVDVFRLNFSHGAHEDHRKRHGWIRSCEEELGRPLGIMMDLQGPKLRIGTFKDSEVMLNRGQNFRLYRNDIEGDETGVTLPHNELFQVMRPGLELLLNDGRVVLRVMEVDDEGVDCEVRVGGVISDRKGLNVPAAMLPIKPLTKKDLTDLEFGLELGIDWCALSFVQRPEDLREARKLIKGRAALLAKIEKPQAVENLDEIVQVADGLMVARGDLGVEYTPERVPAVQKRLIRACREQCKPVIVATQMLESMIDAPIPTRAEASDVANAIYDGADAVMLSAETAVGSYACNAVSVMDRIALVTEQDPDCLERIANTPLAFDLSDSDAISKAASDIALSRDCKAIVAFTKTGVTSQRVSRTRTPLPLLSLTPDINTARRLTMVWGVHSVNTGDVHNFAEMIGKATRIARREKLAKDEDNVVVIAGVPFGQEGSTNVLRIAQIGEVQQRLGSDDNTDEPTD